VHALERREREIRSLTRPEDDARLQSERDSLQRRLTAEQDAVTRQRLGQALEALDQQRNQRAALITAASRLEAERTRLLYTLEGLHTQVLAVRSTAEAGQEQAAAERLRQSLDTLSGEVSAVAGALESVQAVDAGAVPAPAPSVPDARLPERG
jgi:nitrogen fixation/metabolism regulation signal transduction histidine kinase